MVRFIHTSDLQIGMPFHRVEGDGGARLRALRLSALDRIGAEAQRGGAQFVVVAGDFFDANTVDDEVVVQACERVRRIPVPVYVLPGNHDYCSGPSSVYRRRTFLEHRPDNLQVLDERSPVIVPGTGAVLLPAPLLYRHAKGDTTVHLTAEFGRDVAPGSVRIGVAHGGVVAFELDWDDRPTNYIDPNRAHHGGLDYLALGDWHGCRSVNDRTWYSGTPEPTSMKANDPGYVLLVEIAAPGATPVVRRVPVAQSRWIPHRATIETEDDLVELEAWLKRLDRPEDTVVALTLTGTLPLEALGRLETLVGRMRYLLLDLRLEQNVLARASDDALDAIAGEGYLRVAVDRLRDKVAAGGSEGETAALALQILYRLHASL